MLLSEMTPHIGTCMNYHNKYVVIHYNIIASQSDNYAHNMYYTITVGAQQSVAATPNLTMMTPPVMPPRTYKDNGKSAAQNLMLLPQTSSRIGRCKTDITTIK